MNKEKLLQAVIDWCLAIWDWTLDTLEEWHLPWWAGTLHWSAYLWLDDLPHYVARYRLIAALKALFLSPDGRRVVARLEAVFGGNKALLSYWLLPCKPLFPNSGRR